ncbi:MAG: hypothetical protein KKC39_06820 [Candidatus Omnitrophica bacterium]|nr:hypothetical protein [Candidatus Omnitrophota bacterium]MBU4303572.1 hypothetical protein [Candidatus Omnitrophota bacterium]MBU4468431.1 hypothetical protein [Candidatus Omnitrophota bacterium]MCG2708424.1 DUF6338 family protein [Candidatus Omnitrophota bacterium]
MEIAPNINNMLLFILLVFPGLISMHIYRLLMPAKDIDWQNATIEALFYSSINFGLCLPVLILMNRGNFINDYPFWYSFFLVIIILVIPIILPCLWLRILKNNKFTKHLQLPYPTSWDYFFDKRIPVFVLIHLKNGKKIGGYFGSCSYATSFPREGDLYLEKVISVDEKGEFKEIIKDTYGLLIRKDDYELVEFFEDQNYKKEENK